MDVCGGDGLPRVMLNFWAVPTESIEELNVQQEIMELRQGRYLLHYYYNSNK